MADIDNKIQAIRQAAKGSDVRDTIADGIEAINNEVESTTTKQNNLKSQFDSLVINAGNSNAEIVAGRTSNVTGQTSDTIGHRLDDIENYLNYMPIDGGDFNGMGNPNVIIDGGTY